LLLQQRVFAAVATVRRCIAKMLGAIDFYDKARIRAKKIDLHLATAVKSDR